MAERGGQPGNQNAAKSRLIEQALLREIKQRDLKDGDGETLRKIAAAQIDRALSGEPLAFDRVADRIEGKPAQSVKIGEDADNPFLSAVTRAVVTPRKE